MSKTKRYFDVLLRTRFGLALPKAGLINYAKHYFVRRKPTIDPKHLSPVLMNLTVTTRCNLNCPWCGGEKSKYDNKGNIIDLDMKPDYVERLLNTEIGKRLLIVTITGGEPLLNKDIGDIIRVVKHRRLLCGIITNGIFLQDKLPILLDAGLDEVQLSLHDYNDAYKQLCKIIPPISKEIPIHATYVLTRSVLHNNPEHIDEIIQCAIKMGCKSLRINNCASSTIGGDVSETIFDDDTEYNKLLSRKRDSVIPIFYPTPVKRHLLGIKDKNCRIPWQRIQINNEGESSMCCYFRLDKNRSIFLSLDENEKDANMEALNNPILQNLRTKLLANDNIVHDMCKNCTALVKAYVSKI